MATMHNSANITYKSGDNNDTAISNITTTILIEDYSLKATKTSQNISWRPSENLSFKVRVENDGNLPIYAISIEDNLGGTAKPFLNYMIGSCEMTRGNVITKITPTSNDPLTINMVNPLEAGESVIFSYMATVRSDIGSEVAEITNEVTVAGHQESSTGPVITVIPPPTVVLPKANYAKVSITKSADKESARAGDPLTYLFRLENSGNLAATRVVINDSLPEKFTIESVKSETDGVETIFEPTDYSLDTDNRLVLPTSVTKTISVPAATLTGDGITVVTIAGRVTA